jgi:Co/Zn/Cd efflux system component
MLADAFGYGVALFAIGRSTILKARAAQVGGLMLGILGVSVMVEAMRRAVVSSAPEGAVMLVVAMLSLIVNATVLRMLARYREGDVHLRASWIFTRADLIANVAVILAALLVRATSSRMPDLVIGIAIGASVVREALEIRSIASKSLLREERASSG